MANMTATTDEQNHAAEVIQRNYRGKMYGWMSKNRARASSTAAREKWKKSRTIRRSSLISISSSSSASESDAEAEHYVNEDLDKAKGISKIRYVSAATILNHLLRSSVKPNTWIFTRRRVKHGVAHIKEAEEKVVHPEEHARKVEEQMDQSQSAQRERELLAQEAEQREAEKKQASLSRRIWRRLSRGGTEKDKVRGTARESTGAKQKRKKWLSKPGEDVEDGIAPTGSR
ncbi:hypothetical protein COCHEDRAFT_27843 [Bipolaris maydis C5]|uniref:Uncharacterized protein n=1 Tax=Cochliobolus heterostrophus (strain C5 / ATCC 48332 / race O) TaxID=701091 RepID=M2UJV8_COCH5|nr:hypothetical protein COCHEDRAFT_27843 [Bipolaris maydis C5]KAJ6209390.1 hypothetical protein PSV09DRAFT_27843 [Bipolaris maydis]